MSNTSDEPWCMYALKLFCYAQECQHKNQNSILRSYVVGRRNKNACGKIRFKFFLKIYISLLK